MIWEQSIGPRQGTPIDTFLWSVAGNETYKYETAAGETFGAGYDVDSLEPRDAREVRNLKYLEDNHGGALQVHLELCRKAGMRFIPSYRMNQHYGAAEDGEPVGQSVFRRERPDLKLGAGEGELVEGLDWGIRTGLDFTHAEVRLHHQAVLTEMVSGKYDVDGLELDFMRHPGFFKLTQGRAHGYLLTDLMVAVKAAVDARSAVRVAAGRPALELVVRVPPTLEACVRMGLDVPTWIAENLVDIVVAGEGW
eukprot:SAG22_NODE_1532_length_4207_cov_2.263632_4_plen_251_part_00